MIGRGTILHDAAALAGLDIDVAGQVQVPEAVGRAVLAIRVHIEQDTGGAVADGDRAVHFLGPPVVIIGVESNRPGAGEVLNESVEVVLLVIADMQPAGPGARAGAINRQALYPAAPQRGA